MRKTVTLALLSILTAAPAFATEPQTRRVRRPMPGPAEGESPSRYRSMQLTADPLQLELVREGPLLMVENVMVNGEGPFRFMLDTAGMGAGRVDSTLVEKLALPVAGEVVAGDGTGRRGPAMSLHELESLEIGGLRFAGVTVASRDYNRLAAAVRGPVDGVLGVGLFAELLVSLQPARGRLVVSTGALPPPDGAEILPLLDEPVPAVEIVLAGVSHRAHLDTGSMGPVSVSEEIGATLELASEPVVVGEARTVTGSFSIRQAELDGTLVIGSTVLTNPEVVIGAPLESVNLGGRILGQLEITLDQRNRRVRIVRPSPAEPADD